MSSFNLLEGLRIFRKVVDAGSITGGARDLGISVTWTAKNIERLETHLSVTLLQRTTRTLKLTEAGSSCYDLAGRLMHDVVELEEVIGQTAVTPKGLIRVSAPVSFAVCELGPVLAAFQIDYPDVQLDISLSDRFVDVVDEGFDIALRLMTALPDSGLLARKLASVRRVACATPRYLARNGTPKHPDDLHSHHCLVFSLLWQRNTWPFTVDGAPLHIHPPTSLTTNNSLLIRSALVCDAGVALIPEPIVRGDIEAGTIVPVLVEFEPPPLNLYLMRPSDRRLPRRVSALIDFLVAKLPTVTHSHRPMTEAGELDGDDHFRSINRRQQRVATSAPFLTG